MIALVITALCSLSTIATEQEPARALVLTSKSVDWKGAARMAAIAAIPDRDGDGIEELAAFSWSDMRLTLLSGASGSVVDSLRVGEPETDGTGVLRIAGLADFNSDGALDLLLCGSRWANPPPAQKATNLRVVWSVVDGAKFRLDVGLSSAVPPVLLEPDAILSDCTVIPLAESRFRIVMALMITTAEPSKPKASRTEIWSYDPCTNEQRRYVYDLKPTERIVPFLAQVGDLDGDQAPDLALRTELGTGQTDGGSVLFVSGATMLPIRLVRSRSLDLLSFELGTSISGGTDINGDHVPDIVVGDLLPDHPVWCLSGATGDLVRTIETPTKSPDFVAVHCEVLLIPDCDGDSVGDILVTHPDAITGQVHYAGRVCLHSGATGALLAEFGADPGVEGDFFGQWCAAVRGSKEYKTILFCGGDKTTRWVGVR